MSWELLQGECEDFLCNYDDSTFDAVVTDPPYSYNFMGNSWDNMGGGFQAWNASWGAEVLRVLKPGGYALVFGGTRTYHRLTAGLEDAGFEIRDSIMWVYGSGFPKSKACLKPAYEPIVVARKPAKRIIPFPGLEGCRVENGTPIATAVGTKRSGGIMGKSESRGEVWESPHDGRWPPNLLLTHSPWCELGEDGRGCVISCPVAEMDHQSGHSKSRKQPKTERKGGRATNFAMSTSGRTHDDAGGASRFFPVFLYHAKAGRSERPCVDGIKHPTVKPLELIRWLTKLVTPPGGYVLDPFAGSGTTIEAAELEGFSCLGIEREPKYVRLALKRMSKYQKEAA